jgi:ribosomal protein S18 acetylase RimI-like enzyme
VFVGHPLEEEGLLTFLLTAFPPDETHVWRERLLEQRPGDVCVAQRVENRWIAGVQAQDLGGRAALIWPPACVESDYDWRSLGERLFAELLQQNIHYTQALLPTDRPGPWRSLIALGMTQLTVMDYMVATAGTVPQGAPENLRDSAVEPLVLNGDAADDSFARLCHIVGGTYRQTLDCPELNGIRAVEDVVRGYQTSAPLTAWIFPDGQPAGPVARETEHFAGDAAVLLLSDHPDHDQTELTYMGVLPEYRGRGWGRRLVSHAIANTVNMGRGKIVLAVDRRNGPAIEQYQAAGLQRWASRVCLTRHLDEVDG